jgi:predicted ester cyclase
MAAERARYERYLACCNERRFDDLAEFVDEQVSGSGSEDGQAAYIERVRAVVTGFPDSTTGNCRN